MIFFKLKNQLKLLIKKIVKYSDIKVAIEHFENIIYLGFKLKKYIYEIFKVKLVLFC